MPIELDQLFGDFDHDELRFRWPSKFIFFCGGKIGSPGIKESSLILTPSGKVSIGRNRKRQISSMLHHVSLGQLKEKEIAYLKGMLGFAIGNEPEFVSRMRLKYGSEVLDKVLAFILEDRQK